MKNVSSDNLIKGWNRIYKYKTDFSQTLNNDMEKKIKKIESYYKKIIKPSSAEIEEHKKFLKNNLKKNYFN